MLTIIAPAKTLDFETPPVTREYTLPVLLDESEKIAGRLKKMKPAKLSQLMNVSDSLAALNFHRYQSWQQPFTPDNSKQALLAFNGEVYAGLQATSLTEEQLKRAQFKLRILSGLYGVLRPLDLIQPYRLEMGTTLNIGRKKDLYAFWGNKITRHIQQAIDESGSKILVNLASNEYYKSIDKSRLDARIVTPAFKEMKNGEYKIITIYAKKARGLMTRFILENNIEQPEELQAFDAEGYHYNARLSQPDKPVFTRG